MSTPLRPVNSLIRNHSTWLDTEGNPIDCHEGAILRVGDTFYWYGRVYKGNPDGIYGAAGAGYRCGFACYSSTDLVNWTNRGIVLPYPESGWLTEGTWHRVRPIYNATTKKYVLWFFCLKKAYPPPAVVATSDSPTGPFTIVGQPGGNYASGDIALLLDQDGQGYLCHDGGSGGRKACVVRLSPDFLSVTGPETLAMPVTTDHEGECIARYKGKYIVAASGLSGMHAGVGPSDSYYAVADAPMGPYTYKNLLSVAGTQTWNSQIGSFFYIAETDTLMALCDQWFVGPNGEAVTCEKSCQLWLPVSFDSDTGTAKLEFVEQWAPSVKGSLKSQH